jgi:aflatoxin B1 aldehyde reductase
METKYYLTANKRLPSSWNQQLRYTPERLRENLEKSLKALKTDALDMWSRHNPNRTTSFDVTMKAVNDLGKEGKSNRLGILNFQAWEVAQTCQMRRPMGGSSLMFTKECTMPFNAQWKLSRFFSSLRHYGVAMYNYHPLAGGYLTSRYHREDQDAEIGTGSRFDPNR